MEPTAAQSHNPWLTVSAALMGVIVGYGVASVHVGWLMGPSAATAQLVQNPGAPAAPVVPPPPPPPAADPPEVTDADHVRGNRDAKVTIIEYSDFQCPFCANVEPTLKQVLADYGDDVNMVYRHFPLSFHPQAQKSAEASECAADLGGNEVFWDYHDRLFANQSTLGDAKFIEIAKELNLDEAAFTDCLTSGKFAKLVQDQMAAGSSAGVQGTPASFVVDNETGDAQMVSGAVPLANFKAAIDSVLQ